MRVYIGNLAQDVTVDELTETLKPFGLLNCRVHFDGDSGRSSGFGLAEVKKADEAVESLDGKSLKGRIMRVSRAVMRVVNASD